MLEPAASTRAAKLLAVRFGGDQGSADWRPFGRLTGFTNPKPERRLESGMQPFARLVEASGLVYSRAPVFIAEVRASLADIAVMEAGEGDRAGRGAPDLPPLKPLEESHRDPCYGGDLHRADMAWALHAASPDLSGQEIEAEILHARDLSKRVASGGGSITPVGLPKRRAPQSSRPTSSAASLWTARRGRRTTVRALAFGKRAGNGISTMDTWVMHRRKAEGTENWIKCHLWGRFRDFPLALLRRVPPQRE